LSVIAEGFQVPPAELEAKLHGHEKIADCCVVGVWDRNEHTEVPRAYVQTRPGVEPSDELGREIAEWLAAQVAPPKKLRGGVRFVDLIPKSASGKILRRLIRDQARKEDEAPKAKL
jgi:acyl-coenzyme A synthetase/AMP-(fatty) acid ligase